MGDADRLRLELSSDRFDRTDDRWLDQQVAFLRELRAAGTDVTTERAAVEGAKGVTDSVFLALGSAGALTATVELIKAWLARDHARSVKVSWSEGGQLQSVEVSGGRIDDAALDKIVHAMSDRVADGR